MNNISTKEIFSAYQGNGKIETKKARQMDSKMANIYSAHYGSSTITGVPAGELKKTKVGGAQLCVQDTPFIFTQ